MPRMTTKPNQDHPRRWLTALLSRRLGALERVLSSMDRHGLTPRQVHKLRVAARRLRNALRLAQLWNGCKPFGTLAKKLGKFTAEFGALRDLDVQAEFLGRAAKWLEPGMKPALRHLQRRYAKARRRLAETLSGRLCAGHKLADKIHRAAAGLDTVGKNATADNWRTRLADAVHELQTAYQAAAKSALAAPDDAALHNWRIAAKKLRYRLEALEALYGGGLGAWIERLTELQNALGEAHDAAVFRETFRTIAAEAETTGGGGTGGLRNFQACARRVLALNQARKRREIRKACGRLHVSIGQLRDTL